MGHLVVHTNGHICIHKGNDGGIPLLLYEFLCTKTIWCLETQPLPAFFQHNVNITHLSEREEGGELYRKMRICVHRFLHICMFDTKRHAIERKKERKLIPD